MENAERFFSRIDKGEFEIAVELGGWSEDGIKRFVRGFDVMDVTDPLVRIPLHHGDLKYYRLHGRYEKGRIVYSNTYADEELRKIRERVIGWNKGESLVYFNNSNMRADSKHFRATL